MLSETVVGWLLLAGALLTFAGGIFVRLLLGRHRNSERVQRIVRGFRGTAVARVLFGPIAKDALDDGELDAMILMPAIIISCGLCLVAVFLFGYKILT
ncbi:MULTISPECIES: hypothetical protein [unclassified Mycobacterium]|uniref:hypothetical protein n=1 Tax=unclassified Mycobacterium TaxID=2642494 RepID=UPI0029C64291|nr:MULTISPECIES: hypothetical protein [unclassified Mycobacterium]